MHDEVIDRQEPADRQRRRTDLRGLRRTRRAGRARSEDELDRGDRDPDARAARPGAVALPATESAVALLGRYAPVGEPAVQPGRSAQPDARQQGPRVADDEDPPQRRIRRGAPTRRTSSRRGSRCEASGRQASFYDPKTKQFTLVDTCYATHHLQFDNDANETVYFNELSGPIVGWIDTKVFDETKDEQKAVGWCGQVVDTNGDGRITARLEPRSPRAANRSLYAGDTAGDTGAGGRPRRAGRHGAGGPRSESSTRMVSFSLYGVMPSPVDNSVWGVVGALPRLPRPRRSRQQSAAVVHDRGLQRARRRASIRAASTSTPTASSGRRWPRAAIWPASIAASARRSPARARFDGSECPEGWTLYQTTGPKFKGTERPGRLPLLQLGGSTQRAWASARTRRSPTDRTPIRCSC